jgi:hypothetical protein
MWKYHEHMETYGKIWENGGLMECIGDFNGDFNGD